VWFFGRGLIVLVSSHQSHIFISLSLLSVGSPIYVDKVTSPSDEQIEKLHAEYKEGLKRLFEENRNKYGVPRDIKLIIQ